MKLVDNARSLESNCYPVSFMSNQVLPFCWVI